MKPRPFPLLLVLAAVTYSQHVAPILDWRCSECHSVGAGLDLTRFPFYSKKQLDQATIVRKILALTGASPALMPPGNRPKLTAAEQTVIRQWQEQGLSP